MKKNANSRGRPGPPSGEGHPNAVLTDRQVEAMREEYEEGFTSYSALALKYECSKTTVAQICRYERRAG